MPRLLLICLTMMSGLCAVTAADDWPQWRGPERDGRAAGESIRTDWSRRPPGLLWMVDGMGQGYASVAVVDGTLYTTGNDRQGQKVVAVDAASGALLWSKAVTDRPPQHSYPGARCTPTVDEDQLYVVTSDGSIACLARSDGEVLWQKDFAREWRGKLMSDWGFSESPLLDEDAVICTPGGDGALMVKLDKQTGKELWRTAVPENALAGRRTTAAYSSPVVSHAGGVKQYVQMTGGGLVGVNAETGKVLWTYGRVANGTANIPTPIPVDDYVFASTGYRTGAALLHLTADGRGGVRAKEVYFLDGNEFQNHHGGMVRYGEYVYAGNGHRNGFPTCLNWKTGDIVWGGKARGAGQGSAAVTGLAGHLLFRYEDGTLALIEATPEKYDLAGTLRPEFQEGKSWSHPVVVDGRLYLREQDKLMCYDVTR
jgi:outer membrane protein assembly factor BamB